MFEIGRAVLGRALLNYDTSREVERLAHRALVDAGEDSRSANQFSSLMAGAVPLLYAPYEIPEVMKQIKSGKYFPTIIERWTERYTGENLRGTGGDAQTHYQLL